MVTTRMRASLAGALALAALAAALLILAPARSDARGGHGGGSLPATLALPTGWQPEGIAAGPGKKTLLSGSLADGSILSVNVKTGERTVVVPGAAGRSITGIKYDRGLIWASGRNTGKAYVFDAETGATVAEWTLGPAGSAFINDVTLTDDAAYFTDSLDDTIVKVERDDEGAPAGDPQRVQLTGDFAIDDSADTLELNGIWAARGVLYAVQSAVGKLYRIDPDTGETDAIELTGGDGNVVNGDGILVKGRTLYVVQNRLNKIAVIKLSRDGGSGVITRYITNDALDVPTTIAIAKGNLYAVNARFGIADPQNADYAIVRLGKVKGGHDHGGRHHGRGDDDRGDDDRGGRHRRGGSDDD